MRKIFTLVMAAAAVLSVSAAPAAKLVRTNSLNSLEVKAPAKAEFKQIQAVNAEAIANMSRAGEDEAVVDITGRYYAGCYDVIADFINGSSDALGEFIEGIDYFEIVADPGVENGYLVKGFLQEWWNAGLEEGSEPQTFNDLKATWDAEKQQLTIAPYQLLFVSKDEKGNESNNHLTMASAATSSFSKTTPLVLDYTLGIFTMNESVAAFGLGEIVDNNPDASQNGFWSLPYQFAAVTAYIPNGSMKFFVEELAQDEDAPIHGVWRGGAFFVNNFTSFDPITIATFLYDKQNNKLLYDGKYGRVGWVLRVLKIPGEAQQMDLNMQLYAAEMTEAGEPTGTGYNVTATVDVANNDAVKVTFPTFGLFTEQDEFFASIQDGVLEFNPGEVAGIENVAAADVDNTNAPVRYYNLQGMSVNAPANGVFIRVQGTDVQKVLVK